MTPPLGRLHVLTDADGGPAALAAIAAAVAAGAPVVQVRAKGCSDRVLYEFARAVVELCRPAGTTCLVNDRVDVALAVGADGTHLGAGDLPLAAARRVAGPGHLLGGTARDPELARQLVAEGADYLGVGPAFATTTKTGLPDPIGVAGVGAVAAAVPVPVIAIGGVTAARVGELLAAGATGVAVVGAVTAAADPGAATAELLRALAGAR
ncbi:thiamine phosphate synthase [Modestobacter sp. VKM Ac-2979]|uniref:thiamine phosphate synthase n=1 Tax=unclassified Modestobacter TaxID=2643866 RepID=UPI0022ABAD67|nr:MULTISPECIES: thiamine phosphate synthase [unclassified Modestobacter]MCZ2810832.1 thiamine phosphate synthase [Modestobacter sp. VKM Ac-2979]MCZ2840345.1 thiamine phosphate synthase [Modestobacter sp. VKM Ac-2980]